MDRAQVDRCMAAFVADLRVGDEPVPLDRVLAAHLGVFEAMRATGLTWRGIAALVSRAGGRRRDGGFISPDQLRADVARLLRRRQPERPADKLRKASARRAATSRGQRLDPQGEPVPRAPSLGPTPVRDGYGVERSGEAKAVSTSDIDAALKRIHTI